jgi:hypothetical protein
MGRLTLGQVGSFQMHWPTRRQNLCFARLAVGITNPFHFYCFDFIGSGVKPVELGPDPT